MCVAPLQLEGAKGKEEYPSLGWEAPVKSQQLIFMGHLQENQRKRTLSTSFLVMVFSFDICIVISFILCMVLEFVVIGDRCSIGDCVSHKKFFTRVQFDSKLNLEVLTSLFSIFQFVGFIFLMLLKLCMTRMLNVNKGIGHRF
jgi:hypothetical protein